MIQQKVTAHITTNLTRRTCDQCGKPLGIGQNVIEYYEGKTIKATTCQGCFKSEHKK